jgi:restriction system protein
MPGFWMVRAGEGGYLINDFERTSCVGIGWEGAGDFTHVITIAAMRARIDAAYPEGKPASRAVSASTALKFRQGVKVGDRIVSYDPKAREYLVGTITGEYQFKPGVLPDYNHVRAVDWDGRVSRDDLSPTSRNSLGSLVTIFQPGEDVLRELETALAGKVSGELAPSVDHAPQKEDLEIFRRDVADQAHEFLKDLIRALSPDDMEELTASLLRAMGFKARVTPKGADRGRDVIASRDGLGLEAPRIVAEVKHRSREAMGAPNVRAFLGGLREGDRGLYVSTGGFTREARYEGERSNIPVALVDLDDLSSLVVEHYERFDSNGRALVPLVKIYWPVT